MAWISRIFPEFCKDTIYVCGSYMTLTGNSGLGIV
jgi:hypothetical protein